MLTNRQNKILKAIIEEYVQTAEPVGSKSLTELEWLPYSSATIRNEMSYLEELGLIYKTHSSSGRVPTEEGYRVYVEMILLSEKQINDISYPVIDQIFSRNQYNVEQAIKESMALITKLTDYTTVVLGVTAYNTRIKKLEFVALDGPYGVLLMVTDKGYVESQRITLPEAIRPQDIERVTAVLNNVLQDCLISEIDTVLEEKLKNGEIDNLLYAYDKLLSAMVNSLVKLPKDKFFLSGQTNMLNQPEFQDVDKIKALVKSIENQEILQALDLSGDKISVKIGDENKILAMKDCTVITVPYKYGDNEKGAIAVIGPTRMEYQKVIPLLEYVAELIKNMT